MTTAVMMMLLLLLLLLVCWPKVALSPARAAALLCCAGRQRCPRADDATANAWADVKSNLPPKVISFHRAAAAAAAELYALRAAASGRCCKTHPVHRQQQSRLAHGISSPTHTARAPAFPHVLIVAGFYGRLGLLTDCDAIYCITVLQVRPVVPGVPPRVTVRPRPA